MLRTRERAIYEGPKASSPTLGRNYPAQFWNPPFADFVSIPFVVPGFQSRYEKIRDEDWSAELNHQFDTGVRSSILHRWKQVQHYIRWVDLSPLKNQITHIPWTSIATTSLGLYSSILNGNGVTGKTAHADRLLVTDTTNFRSQFGKFGEHISGLPSLIQADIGDGFVPKPVGLNLLTRSALAEMLPHIKAELSSINSIIELKDFASLPKTLSSIVSIGTRFLSVRKAERLSRSYWLGLPMHLRDLYRTFRAPPVTLRQLFHAGSDGYLQAQFNILPLLRDISGIQAALSKIDRVIRRSLSQAGTRQRRHYDFEWQEYESPTLYLSTLNGQSLTQGQFAGSTNPIGRTGINNGHAQVFNYTRRTTHYNRTTFHAEIDYSYYYSAYQREHAPLLALLDVMGVNLNPQIIWNAIPWSFVVDWVYSVSKYLGEHKTINMEPLVSVHRYLWSWTRHRKTATFFKSTANQNSGSQFNPSITETYLPDLYETTYRRDISLPDSSSSLFGSGLSATELSLGVALYNTSLPRPRTR